MILSLLIFHLLPQSFIILIKLIDFVFIVLFLLIELWFHFMLFIDLNWVELSWVELSWLDLSWLELSWGELSWFLSWLNFWARVDWFFELRWYVLYWVMPSRLGKSPKEEQENMKSKKCEIDPFIDGSIER